MEGGQSKNRTSREAPRFGPFCPGACASPDPGEAPRGACDTDFRRRAGRGFSGVCRARLRGEDAVVHAREPQEWDPAVGEPLQPLMEPDVPSVPEEFETEEGEG